MHSRQLRAGVLLGGLLLLLMILLFAPAHAQERTITVYNTHPQESTLRPHWEFVKLCSGAKVRKGGDLKDIKWYIAAPYDLDAPGTADMEYGRVLGRWIPPDTILLDSLYAGAAHVVQHEMLHHLLRGRVSGEMHPVFPWKNPCMLMGDANIPEGVPEENLRHRGDPVKSKKENPSESQ